MNDIVSITSAPTLTMSSLEIAGLTGKRHDHVIRDVRKMLSELGIAFPQNWGKVPSGRGRPLEIVNLPKRETLILVSGYSVQMRARIIDRWQELEAALVAANSTAGLVTDLDPGIRKVIGGILKNVIHSELTAVIPALVRSELASQAIAFRACKSSNRVPERKNCGSNLARPWVPAHPSWLLVWQPTSRNGVPN